MFCRFCKNELEICLVDLGSAPPSNAYLTHLNLNMPEKWFPLRVMVCNRCWLVQTEDFAAHDELFTSEYAYFSSVSKSWLTHSQIYQKAMSKRFQLDRNSNVVEVAANDGYLLQYFQADNIPCLGIEPTASTASAARKKGIEIIEDFFGEALGTKLTLMEKSADLTAANNVLAHVPDINDFVKGFKAILKPNGVSTFEFPSLLNLLNFTQFDTIYHEHYSYLSLTAVDKIFAKNGLKIFDVEDIETHGGSLRVFAQRADFGKQKITKNVEIALNREKKSGIDRADIYKNFQKQTENIKNNFISFLLETKKNGATIAAYGAAAKGNTLINYAGVRPDLLPYVVDRSPGKQGKFLPGSRIPIVGEDFLKESKPNFILVLPWNLKNEIFQQLSYVREWGGRFVTAVPELRIE